VRSASHYRMLVLARFLALFLVIATSNSRPLTAYGREEEHVSSSNHAVTISVLGLFHPQEFIVSAPDGHALVLQAADHSMVLESSQVSAANVRIDASGLIVASAGQAFRASTVNVVGRVNQSEDFILEVPDRIRRRYHGTLTIRPSSGNLLAVVTLDLETAVASVVAAESAPDTAIEAIKAYAVAARSYFVAGRGRHRSFDFCDTTHCQFLRTAPPATGNVAHAVEATRGLVLAYQSRPFAAMYTRSCSGRTRTPAELGLPAAAYPYYSVVCDHCRQHPVRWISHLSVHEAASLRPQDENNRLAVAKRLGWSAVPSNDFSLARNGDHILLNGVGNGHGIGLCQAGAKAMAESGAGFQEILKHYYPNADIVEFSKATLID